MMTIWWNEWRDHVFWWSATCEHWPAEQLWSSRAITTTNSHDCKHCAYGGVGAGLSRKWAGQHGHWEIKPDTRFMADLLQQFCCNLFVGLWLLFVWTLGLNIHDHDLNINYFLLPKNVQVVLLLPASPAKLDLYPDLWTVAGEPLKLS